MCPFKKLSIHFLQQMLKDNQTKVNENTNCLVIVPPSDTFTGFRVYEMQVFSDMSKVEPVDKAFVATKILLKDINADIVNGTCNSDFRRDFIRARTFSYVDSAWMLVKPVPEGFFCKVIDENYWINIDSIRLLLEIPA